MDAASTVATIMGDYTSVEQWQTEIYLDLHRNPELSMQEVRTRGVIARELEALGYRVDPIVLAAHVVQRLQTIVARELSPHEFGVVTVGVVEAGTRPNVIPETARLKLNVRAYDEAVRARILAAIERITRGEAAAAGAPREPEFRYYESFPVTDNDDVVASRLTASFGRDLGEKNVHRIEPLTASEDFSVLADAFGAPYCFWLLGGAPEGVSIPNHSPKFAPVLQPTLETGTRALVSAACEYLR